MDSQNQAPGPPIGKRKKKKKHTKKPDVCQWPRHPYYQNLPGRNSFVQPLEGVNIYTTFGLLSTILPGPPCHLIFPLFPNGFMGPLPVLGAISFQSPNNFPPVNSCFLPPAQLAPALPSMAVPPPAFGVHFPLLPPPPPPPQQPQDPYLILSVPPSAYRQAPGYYPSNQPFG